MATNSSHYAVALASGKGWVLLSFMLLLSLKYHHLSMYRVTIMNYYYAIVLVATCISHITIVRLVTILNSTGGNNPFSSLTLLVNEDSALKDWYKTTVQLPIPALLNNFQVNKVSLVPTNIESDPFQLLYSTQSHLVLQV